MQAEDVRSNECVAETIVDLSLATVLEEEKFKNDLRSQWNTWRSQYREFYAEFFATLLMVLLGNATIATHVFTDNKLGLFPSLGYGLAVTMAIYVAGDISGAHLNPAITFTLCLFRKFPLRKFPMFMLTQVLGSFCAAAILYVNISPDLDRLDGGVRQVSGQNETLTIFATTPASSVDTMRAIGTETACSAILLFINFSIMDRLDVSIRAVQPILIGTLVTLISLGMGVNTGPSMNPARDFGPRLFTALAGWGFQVFTSNNYYFWIPSLLPFVGGFIGALLYYLFLDVK
ncbi:aquaporin 9 [Umbelopsis sp. PMI_123]|nr:aquaporin 9 [Umbelopsis sp. PMI_123]